MIDFSMGDALVTSGIGIAVVFVVLAFLMLTIKTMSGLLKSADKGKMPEVPAPPVSTEPVSEPAANVSSGEQEAAAPMWVLPGVISNPVARGSCGELKLFDVPDKTAAMLMAITAEKLGIPLAQLRFISIKEVK